MATKTTLVCFMFRGTRVLSGYECSQGYEGIVVRGTRALSGYEDIVVRGTRVLWSGVRGH